MAKIVALINQKGGVGKTTTAVNLACALTEKGKKVLLCDFDPQGNATSGVGIEPHELEASIYELIIPTNPMSAPLSNIPSGSMCSAPMSIWPVRRSI